MNDTHSIDFVFAITVSNGSSLSDGELLQFADQINGALLSLVCCIAAPTLTYVALTHNFPSHLLTLWQPSHTHTHTLAYTHLCPHTHTHSLALSALLLSRVRGGFEMAPCSLLYSRDSPLLAGCNRFSCSHFFLKIVYFILF